MNAMHDLDKAYVSPYDRLLYQFDLTHEKSLSQLEEIQKHARLHKMRDDYSYEDDSKIWETF